MKFYKVFRVEDGELYSAFEGWNGNYSQSYLARKVHYKVGKVAKDPKPLGEHCPGLMILLDKKRAITFLKHCGPSSCNFVLREIVPKAIVTIPLDELSYQWSYLCGHTDALQVGRKVKGVNND